MELQYRDTCVKAQFARVFGPSASQAELFEALAANVDRLFAGQSSSVLAYGNTGSGKTYSIYGGDWTALDSGDGAGSGSEGGISLDTRGLVLRIPRAIFEAIEAAAGDCYLSVKYYQLYNERLLDMIIVADR